MSSWGCISFFFFFHLSITVLSHLDPVRYRNSEGGNPETADLQLGAPAAEGCPEECKTLSLSLMDGQRT